MQAAKIKEFKPVPWTSKGRRGTLSSLEYRPFDHEKAETKSLKNINSSSLRIQTTHQFAAASYAAPISRWQQKWVPTFSYVIIDIVKGTSFRWQSDHICNEIPRGNLTPKIQLLRTGQYTMSTIKSCAFSMGNSAHCTCAINWTIVYLQLKPVLLLMPTIRRLLPPAYRRRLWHMIKQIKSKWFGVPSPRYLLRGDTGIMLN